MTYLFLFILMVGVLGYVALPLFRGSRERRDSGYSEATELEAQKAATYSAIKELEFDYQMGNLSPADHQEMEEKYKAKAAQVLKDLDELKGPRRADSVELQIAKRRRAAGASLEDEVERQIAARRGKTVTEGAGRTVACPKCGKQQKASARFCANCGASLGLACPSCGKSYSPQDRFCAGCGAGLGKENKSSQRPA